MIKFKIDWKIRWEQYEKIGNRSMKKYFVTAIENHPMRWCAKMEKSEEDEKMIEFYIYYKNGPTTIIDGVEFKIGIVKENEYHGVRKWNKYQAQRGLGVGFPKFEDQETAVVRAKRGLKESEPLIYRIKMKIPTAAFVHNIPSTIPSWTIPLFKNIQTPQNPSNWDVKLISNDGEIFYCHKVIIGSQSIPLNKYFGNSLDEPSTPKPKAGTKRKASGVENQEMSSPKKKKINEFPFPNLSSTKLKSIIEYFYTGNVTIGNLKVKEIFEIIDIAEELEVQSLKDLCAFVCFQRASDDPLISGTVVYYAYRHGMEYLMDQAMDLILENYQEMGLKTNKLASYFGGGKIGRDLRDQYIDYAGQRAQVSRKS